MKGRWGSEEGRGGSPSVSDLIATGSGLRGHMKSKKKKCERVSDLVCVVRKERNLAD